MQRPMSSRLLPPLRVEPWARRRRGQLFAALVTVLAIVLAWYLSGCSRNSSQPAAVAVGVMSVDQTATSAVEHSSTPIPDGSPQIVTEPDGVHIEYRIQGHGDPAIMLIHDWATDANYWRSQIDALQARYTVVLVDLAGHGASTRNRSDWSMQEYGGDVAAVAARVANSSLVLVGHGMGAAAALEATPRIGERVIGIVAVDSLRDVGLPAPSAAQIERRVAPFRSEYISAVRSYAIDTLFARGADSVLAQKVAYDMSLEPPEVAVPSLGALLSQDYQRILPEIHVPVMAINSDLLPTDVTRIRRSLPRFHVDVVPGTGHFLMMEEPGRFNTLLLHDIELLTAK